MSQLRVAKRKYFSLPYVFSPLNPKREILDVLGSFLSIPVFVVCETSSAVLYLYTNTHFRQEIRAFISGKKYRYPNT